MPTLLSRALVAKEEAIEYVRETFPLSAARDSVMIRLINSVTLQIESYCRRVFVSTTYTEYQDGGGLSWLRLNEYPIDSITSVDRIDSDDVSLETLASSGYYVEHNSLLHLRGEDAFESGTRNYKIVYMAGGSSVPDDIVLSALALIARAWRDFDKSRDDVVSMSMQGQTTTYNVDAIPPKVKAVLNRYRVPH